MRTCFPWIASAVFLRLQLHTYSLVHISDNQIRQQSNRSFIMIPCTVSITDSKLSVYATSLRADKPVVFQRYLEKIDNLKVDPYLLWSQKKLVALQKSFKIMSADIYEFFVLRTSFYTHEQLRAFKGLEAYNMFASTWVSNVRHTQLNGYQLIMCEVMHSMKLNAPNLVPWVILEKNDTIRYSHCTCMAGLGEACSHIAALVFYLNFDYRYKVEKSVTEEFAYWKPQRKEVTPRKLRTIRYEVPSKLIVPKKSHQTSYGVCYRAYMKCNSRKNLVSFLHIAKSEIQKSMAFNVVAPFSDPVEDDADENLNEDSNDHLNDDDDDNLDNGIAPLSPIADSNAPMVFEFTFPRVLNTLYKSEYEEMTVEQLVEIGKGMVFDLTLEERTEIEYRTKLQSNCTDWINLRCGRFTASHMRDVLYARYSISMTTLKSICYPGRDLSYMPAIAWGTTHEEDAKKAYVNKQMQSHSTFTFERSGLWVHEQFPFIAATPDGLVNCECCGQGLVEFKCPYTMKDGGRITEASVPYINKGELKEDHQYFYQIQTQLLVTKASYADFCIWTPTSIFVQRIWPNQKIFTDIEVKCKITFAYVVVPELLGRKFTSSPELLKETRGPNIPKVSRRKEKKLSCYLCKGCSTEDKSITMFKFPKNNGARLDHWKTFCSIPPSVLVRTLYLCERHFIEEDIVFSAINGNKTLKRGSVPKIT